MLLLPDWNRSVKRGSRRVMRQRKMMRRGGRVVEDKTYFPCQNEQESAFVILDKTRCISQ